MYRSELELSSSQSLKDVPGKLRFSALMQLSKKEHDVFTGSIRSVLAVYYQALLMFPSFQHVHLQSSRDRIFGQQSCLIICTHDTPSITAFVRGKLSLLSVRCYK